VTALRWLLRLVGRELAYRTVRRVIDRARVFGGDEDVLAEAEAWQRRSRTHKDWSHCAEQAIRLGGESIAGDARLDLSELRQVREDVRRSVKSRGMRDDG
jgi:hypothetical protein